jgi:GH25 family lysozyme M1 (1,4-beta-N-acetylmuramidase)
MLHGIDVASYQGAHPDFTGCQVVAIKVTQGNTYVNPYWQSQLAAAREKGCRIVFYHYPSISANVQTQFSHFVNTIGTKLQPRDALCLDWEWYDQHGISEQMARDFKDKWVVISRTAKKNKCIIYCDVNNWKNVDTNSNAGDGLWIADYVTAGKPRIKHPWIGHQYTSKPVDKDVWNFPDVQHWDVWAMANFPKPPAFKEIRIAKGDTFTSLAKKYGISIEKLVDDNPQLLKVGEPLRIPNK